MVMRKMSVFIVAFIFQISATFGQVHPTSNLLLFEMQQVSDTLFRFLNPKFLTAVNKAGYNNQPYFFSGDELYYTAQNWKDTSQTDIMALNLKTTARYRVTATAESEYSPTLMPNKTHFSAVRVEADKTQRLWKFPLDRKSAGEPVFKNIKNIGYHCWLSDTKVALFIVGEPHYLLIADTKDESSVRLNSNIGRCFQRFPNGNLAFIFKATDDTWYIQELDLKTMQSKIVVKTLGKSEDFLVTPDGTIIMGQGTRLYKFHPAFDKSWMNIGDFASYRFSNIRRLALSPTNKLVMVAE